MCLALGLIAAAFPTFPVYGQSVGESFGSDDALTMFAVIVDYAPPLNRRFPGFGIYLGHGAVITAAHVVGRRHFLTGPRVRMAGVDLPAKLIKQGSFEATDLALLTVDEARLPLRLRLRRIPPLC